MLNENEKLLIKSNRKCVICQKDVLINQCFVGSKTKRNSYFVAHIGCLYKERR